MRARVRVRVRVRARVRVRVRVRGRRERALALVEADETVARRDGDLPSHLHGSRYSRWYSTRIEVSVVVGRANLVNLVGWSSKYRST